ncbi:TetR/AcrR family transcriptional regulator [Azohydromonas caseinilytica]|uniref:TetR/AcrR family transcriptional regulator n=1 Tax=Azohydromonas caseinilytica TaxID=2728836 RepID=A0A848FFD5_9BURK|nr:TetR/AcrR family transcriptional regulator [Azohydromonas caseinilytica]NML17992.1 TetR/AcrR family transcriptional regulator [Azohydromonas caseinilytica]
MTSPKNANEPRTRDAERSRQAILDAARAAFAENGLGGTRLEHIAERAGVDKRLIYYYFENKEKLFLAALEEVYADIRRAELELNLTELDPVTAIRRLTEFTWQYHAAHPEFITLVNSENLHRAKHLAQSQRIRELHSPLIEILAKVLERGRTEGVFRGGVDPQQLYITIAGLSYFYLSNRYTLSVIFGRPTDTPKALQERLSHICDVVLGYLLR